MERKKIYMAPVTDTVLVMVEKFICQSETKDSARIKMKSSPEAREFPVPKTTIYGRTGKTTNKYFLKWIRENRSI